ncbi:UNVERIFIED_CONTAM: hypothetical protein K2H54_002430 [Gekko kuhli]
MLGAHKVEFLLTRPRSLEGALADTPPQGGSEARLPARYLKQRLDWGPFSPPVSFIHLESPGISGIILLPKTYILLFSWEWGVVWKPTDWATFQPLLHECALCLI